MNIIKDHNLTCNSTQHVHVRIPVEIKIYKILGQGHAQGCHFLFKEPRHQLDLILGGNLHGIMCMIDSYNLDYDSLIARKCVGKQDSFLLIIPNQCQVVLLHVHIYGRLYTTLAIRDFDQGWFSRSLFLNPPNRTTAMLADISVVATNLNSSPPKQSYQKHGCEFWYRIYLQRNQDLPFHESGSKSGRFCPR